MMMMSVMLGWCWVLAAAGTALLPMRRQMAPGWILLLSAPVLIAWMALEMGWWAGAVALLAGLSVVRRPLGALPRSALARGTVA